LEQIKKFYTKDLSLRISAAITTELVREMVGLLDTFPIATIGLGRLVTGTALMASQLADGQALSVRVHGDGPLGHLCAEASYEGKIRAYCQVPDAMQPANRKGKLDLSSAVGDGYLSVARTLPFQKEPHMGIVPLLSGEIGEDLAFYLQQSEQIPSIISLAVSLDKNGDVTHAGGVLVEVMPGTKEDVLTALEQNTKSAPPLSSLLQQGMNEQQLVEQYVKHSPLVVAEHKFALEYFCPCSIERVERTLLLMGANDLEEMHKANKTVEVKCEFCRKNYLVTVDRIKELKAQLDQPN